MCQAMPEFLFLVSAIATKQSEVRYLELLSSLFYDDMHALAIDFSESEIQ